MRHGKKFNHLGRTASHRKAMLSNMACSLILHKRISTTVAKAKELRKYAEPFITRAKEDTTHNRRMVFSYLQNKEAIKELFGPVADKVGSRPGGYTRIIKTGLRLGDNAETCIIELVDYNELLLGDSKAAKKTTRRSRRGSSKAEDDGGVKAEAVAAPKTEVQELPEAEVVDTAEAPEAAATQDETPAADEQSDAPSEEKKPE